MTRVYKTGVKSGVKISPEKIFERKIKIKFHFFYAQANFKMLFLSADSL